jgi:hypothetical protein
VILLANRRAGAIDLILSDRYDLTIAALICQRSQSFIQLANARLAAG